VKFVAIVQEIIAIGCLATLVQLSPVQCFSMQVVLNRCFLLNTEKNFCADPSCPFREKCKNR